MHTHSSPVTLLHPLMLILLWWTLECNEMKSHFTFIEHMISQCSSQRLVDCTELNEVRPTKRSWVWAWESESWNNIQSSSNSSRTAENKLSLCRKVEIFLNSRDASRSLFSSDVFYVLPDLILSQFGAWRLCQQIVYSDQRDEWLHADCAHPPRSNRVTPSSPTQTLHSVHSLHSLLSLHTDHSPAPGLHTYYRGSVSETELPVDRAPGQLDITLTVPQKTNRSRESVHTLQSEQEPWVTVSRVSPQNCLVTDSFHLVTRKNNTQTLIPFLLKE